MRKSHPEELIIKTALQHFIDVPNIDLEINPPIKLIVYNPDKDIDNSQTVATVKIFIDPYIINPKVIDDKYENSKYVTWISLFELKFIRNTCINFIQENIKNKFINTVYLMYVILNKSEGDSSVIGSLSFKDLYEDERYKTLIDNLITKLTVELTKKYFFENNG